MKVVAISGSLRAASYNTMALKAAIELAPAGMSIEIVDIKGIPMFDGDDFAKGFPANVAAIREKIRAADGVLLACPEYNFSMSGAMKNIIDWVSRGADQPFVYKPVAIMSATMGPVGGARMQYDLRKVFNFLQGQVLQKPEVFIGVAQTKFDAAGKLTDEGTRKVVSDFMVSFDDWIKRVKRMAG